MQKTFDITILTEPRFTEEQARKHGRTAALLEDELLREALIRTGLKVTRRSWDDPDFDWSTKRYALFRSTWDYFYRFEEFSKWLKHVSKCCKLLNSESLVRWNMDKHYLLDLKQQGIRVVETEFIEPGTKATLSEIHDRLGWQDTVLKPCVSGTARHTYRLGPENLDAHESIFQSLIQKEALMLSPFQNSIVSDGELSLVLVEGRYSHTVLKRAKPGEYRVQNDFGGTAVPHSPTAETIQFAEQVVKACQELPIYARVDIFTDNDGRTALLELELIEPELWFRHFPHAADTLAVAIYNRIQETPFEEAHGIKFSPDSGL